MIKDTSLKFNIACITYETVKTALDALVYTSQKRSPSLLEDLLLVSIVLMSWKWPRAIYIRTYALHYLLTSFIEQEYFRHRRIHGCSKVKYDIPINRIRACITQDARTRNKELISWGWLYYYFVRVEYGLSALDFCQLTCIDERTLRRYQAHAIHRLTFYLLKKELTAQEYLKKLSLIAIIYGKSTFKAI